MKRLKKTIRILGLVFAMCFILFVLNALWDGLFNCIFPWTRAWFHNYQSYDSFLMYYRCHDYFVRELPMDAGEPKYYWHRGSWETFTAYSTTLPEGAFKTMSNERQEFFREKKEEFSTKSIIYSLQDNDRCYIDDPKWCDNEIISEKKLAFINKVVGNPEAKDQYYYLVILRGNCAGTTCYNGVILNDDAHEFIEFSANVVDPDKWHY
ncbi:MAG: hypothetical protein K2O32_00085 [Acetatifactor sp.]|nr:hypothetical protein [Acetatifactor sp.]